MSRKIVETLRVVSVLLVALTLGLAFAHVMEIPGKLRFDGATWLTVQHNLYVAFGAIGGPIEVASIAVTWVLCWAVRGRRAFPWVLAAAILTTVGLADWFLVVSPMNDALIPWTPESLPADWRRYRDRWELGHAVQALCFAAAFISLVMSLVKELPDRP